MIIIIMIIIIIKNSAGEIDLISPMCFPSSVKQYCGLSSVEGAYCFLTTKQQQINFINN